MRALGLVIILYRCKAIDGEVRRQGIAGQEVVAELYLPQASSLKLSSIVTGS